MWGHCMMLPKYERWQWDMGSELGGCKLQRNKVNRLSHMCNVREQMSWEETWIQENSDGCCAQKNNMSTYACVQSFPCYQHFLPTFPITLSTITLILTIQTFFYYSPFCYPYRHWLFHTTISSSSLLVMQLSYFCSGSSSHSPTSFFLIPTFIPTTLSQVVQKERKKRTL